MINFKRMTGVLALTMTLIQVMPAVPVEAEEKVDLAGQKFAGSLYIGAQLGTSVLVKQYKNQIQASARFAGAFCDNSVTKTFHIDSYKDRWV